MFDTIRSFAERFRMLLWGLIAIILLIALDRSQQNMVLLYKAVMVSGAAWLGYWIDRSLFPYARPHRFLNKLADSAPRDFQFAMIRRALIVSAVILAFSLGL